MALLEIRDLTMKFGSLVANDRVSFEIEEGGIVGLIGPNGAGKTTLFNCISGFYRPTSGAVLFDGNDITDAPAYKVARLGAVRTFQIVHPLKDMTVLDNVMVGASLRDKNMKKAMDIALRCLDWCNLADLASFPAGDLTIGQKKRLEMSRALATEPKLLMLDEAMAGLTSTEVRHSVDLLRKIRERGITLLVVEHIMEAIMPVADKMVVLDGGIKIAEGSPHEIIEDEKVIAAYFGEKFSKRLKNAKEAEKNG